MYQNAKLDQTGTAEHYDGERVDLHVAPSNEMMPTASEFNRQRELAQVAQDIAALSEEQITQAAEELVSDVEQYLVNVARVGEMLSFARSNEE